MLNFLLYLKYAMEELHFNNNKKAVEILHATNISCVYVLSC